MRSLRRFSVTWPLVAALAWLAPSAAAATHHVLRVGTYHGIAGQYSSIQAAVNAAKPGDVVLVAPGDYKTTKIVNPKGHPDFPAGVVISTPRVTLRGMNRNTVIVDGTKSGPTCSSALADQNFGPMYNGSPSGANGVMIYKANNVTVENLTACNFLGGNGDAGNEVWWNGGANSATIGGWGFYGAYLNGTSTFFKDETSAAQYAIFSSNWDGGTWDHTYGSNMNDSAYYIGACQQQCNQYMNDAWGEFSALGYSGSNSGGTLVVKNSQFDNNQDGFDTNSQNGDNPPPQNGACPNNGISPITHTHSCWVFMHNYVHDNNNNLAPHAGLAAGGPVGTGMSVSGARNDTIMNNLFENNGAWGAIFVPFPDNSASPCTGGTPNELGPGTCFYDEWGDALINNTFRHNGFFGNPTNGDFAELNLNSGNPIDCARGNVDLGGTFTSSPSNYEQTNPNCTGAAGPANPNPSFLEEVACDSGQLGTPCVPTDKYPKLGNPVLHPLPPVSKLPSMPKVCSGVPSDPWCSGQVTRIKGCAAASVTIPLSLSAKEALHSLTVSVSRAGVSVTRLGKTAVRVGLGAGAGTVRVSVTELLKVGSHSETVKFTRIYKRC